MFDKLKQLKQLKELQDSLKKEIIEVKDNGTKVVVNGRMEIESITLDSSLSPDTQSEILKKLINKAFKEVQMIAAKNMGML